MVNLTEKSLQISMEDKMNDLVDKQQNVLNELYQIVIGSCPDHITSVKCRFDYDHGYEDGSYSVGSAFSFIKDSEEKYSLLDENLNDPVTGLVVELHSLMKSHTGGDWHAFTLLINEDGTVTTKFEYPEA